MLRSLWTARPLAQCGQLLSGGTPSKTNLTYWNGDIPWFSSKEIKTFELKDSELHVTRSGSENNTTLVPPGTVLFVVRGMSLANEFRVGITTKPATFNQDVKALVPAGDVDGRYLARCLRWRQTQILAATEESSHGTKRLSAQVFENIEIPIPPLAEQRRIANLLDKADALRRKRREAIALTHEFLRSTFLEMFGDPATNPKGWQVRSIAALCESKQYGTAEKANSDRRGLPVLRMGNLTYSGEIDTSDLKWVELPKLEAGKLDLRDGDVLFNRVNSHELVGKTAAWHGGPGYTFAGYLIRLRIDVEVATGDYVAAAMNMVSMKRKLMAMAKPSINMANISGSDLERLHVPVPPLGMQRQYASVNQRVQELRQCYETSATQTDDLFDSLVARAFSGRLGDAAAPC